MFKNYLITAYRNLVRNRMFSFINVIGLAIGLAIGILILQYVMFELSYDDFHENGDRIYRLEHETYIEGKYSYQTNKTVRLMAPTMKKDFPEVVDYCRITRLGDGVLTYGDKKFKMLKHLFVDPSFFSMFSYRMIIGNASTALAQPNSVLISQSAAKRIFKDEDPMGKSFMFDWFNGMRWIFTVRGVFKDIPENSHIRFEFLFPFHFFERWDVVKYGWDQLWFFNYILLAPDADPKAVEAKIPQFLERYIKEDLVRENRREVYHLKAMRDIHLLSKTTWWGDRNIMKYGDIQSVYIMSILAIIILLIVWFNYINLSTVRSIDRSKEVGLRKVVGATREQLIKQFLFESLLINILAIVIAIIFIRILSPYFNQLFGLHSAVSLLTAPEYWLGVLVLLFIGTLLSGIVPAFLLSSPHPVNALKGKIEVGSGKTNLRDIFMILQFAICIALIGGTIAFFNQVSFMRKRDLGIDLKNVILLERPFVQRGIRNFELTVNTLINELRSHPSISGATNGSVPGLSYQSTWAGVTVEGNNTKYTLRGCWVNHDFFDIFKIKLLEGRKFIKGFSDRGRYIILNERAVELLGFRNPGDVLNKVIFSQGKKVGRVIGVAKNYHQETLRKSIEPVMFLYPRFLGFSYIAVKLNTESNPEIIDFIRKKWDEFFPGNLFIYNHMEEFFDRQYNTDKMFGKKLLFFTVFAIFVACLGLFGLSSYTSSQRTKEIGIRKVLGADVLGIILLFLKDIAKLLIIAVLITFPIAYYIFNKLLEDYAYRIGIGWWFFVLPILLIVPIVVLTTIFQIVRLARQNPVDSLRYE